MSTSGTSATLPGTVTPQARRGAAGPGGNEGEHQVAWQREMERAQMATWFKPPVAVRSEAAAVGPGNAVAAGPRHGGQAAEKVAPGLTLGPAPAVSLLPPASLAAGAPMGPPLQSEAPVQAVGVPVPVYAAARPAAAVAAEGDAPVPVTQAVRRAGGGALQAPVPAAPEGPAQASPETAEAPRAQPASHLEAQAPLRLHEEATTEGQAVWIAMRADDDALAAMLPRIVADLQRDMQQLRGQRLHQVVCNGRLVWRGGEFVAAEDAASSFANGEGRSIHVFDSLQSKGA